MSNKELAEKYLLQEKFLNEDGTLRSTSDLEWVEAVRDFAKFLDEKSEKDDEDKCLSVLNFCIGCHHDREKHLNKGPHPKYLGFNSYGECLESHCPCQSFEGYIVKMGRKEAQVPLR